MPTTPSSIGERQADKLKAAAAVTTTATRRRNPRFPKPGCRFIGVFQISRERRVPLKQFRSNFCQRLPDAKRIARWTVDARRERPDAVARSGSRRPELHLLEHRAAEKSVGIRERHVDLEMVVALRDEQLCRFASGLGRASEVAGLP